MAFRRQALVDIEGFDDNLGAGTPFAFEDVDAELRALAAGWMGNTIPVRRSITIMVGNRELMWICSTESITQLAGIPHEVPSLYAAARVLPATLAEKHEKATIDPNLP